MKKRNLSLLLTLLTCLMGTHVYAYDIKVDNDDGISIYYNLINDGTELEVTYLISPSYLMAEGDNSCTYIGDLNIPETVTYMGKTRKVTAIGEYAFFRCVSLTSLTIPTSVSFIGENAFSECKIKSVHISSLEAWFNIQFENLYSNPLSCNVRFYVNGVKVSNLVIPDGITAIKDYAFGNNNITSVTIPNSVTSIGNYAFYWCNGLTSVTIPNSVTSIGSYAFYWCSGLTSITIPNSVTSIGSHAFSVCNQLRSITIPNSVTSIGSFAFYDCQYITSIAITSRVTSIEEGAFSGCYRLASIEVEKDNKVYDSRDNCNAIIETSTNKLVLGCKNTVIPSAVTSIGSYAFSHNSDTSINIPQSVTSIESYAFSNSFIRSVTIPPGVTSISEGTFAGSSLRSVNIPNSIKSIGKYAFDNCTYLKSIDIPNSVISIGDSAFYRCNHLASVTIGDGDGVMSIGRAAFRDCKELTNLTIGNSVNTIGESAFGGCSFPSVIIGDNVKSIGEAAFAGNESLNSVTIGNGLTTISDYTFYNCPNLASVTIGDGVTSIGRGAFYGCKSLASMIIGDNITSIGWDTFSGCKGLTTLTIGSSVNYIGLHAFELCDALTTIISKMVEPCDLYNEFSPKVYKNATLYVPRDSYAAYKSKLYWGRFLTIKEGDPNDPNGIANVESLPALVPGEGGTLHVSGVRQGSPIYVYDISGRLVSYAQASSDVTTVRTTLRSGDVGIVKIGEKTVKVVMR